MKRNFIFSTIAINLIIQMLGQAKNVTDNGFVVSGGKQYFGVISVDVLNNVVKIKQGRDIKVWHSHFVEKAVFTDSQSGMETNYHSGIFGIAPHSYLFEVISKGDLSLLYREGVKFSEYDDKAYPPFFVLKNGQVYSLGQSKKEIMSVFEESYQKRLNDFFKSNSMDPKNSEDLILLFEYYNTLVIGGVI